MSTIQRELFDWLPRSPNMNSSENSISIMIYKRYSWNIRTEHMKQSHVKNHLSLSCFFRKSQGFHIKVEYANWVRFVIYDKCIYNFSGHISTLAHNCNSIDVYVCHKTGYLGFHKDCRSLLHAQCNYS